MHPNGFNKWCCSFNPFPSLTWSTQNPHPPSNSYSLPAIYISKYSIRYIEFSDSSLLQTYFRHPAIVLQVNMAHHFRAAEYVRDVMDKYYARANGFPIARPNPRPAGWIELSHIVPHPLYADAMKKAVFESYHPELFDCELSLLGLVQYVP
jgi:hypothetical protein